MKKPCITIFTYIFQSTLLNFYVSVLDRNFCYLFLHGWSIFHRNWAIFSEKRGGKEGQTEGEGALCFAFTKQCKLIFKWQKQIAKEFLQAQYNLPNSQPGDGILWNQFYTCNMLWTSSNCKISVAIVPFNNLLQSQEYQYLVASYFLDYGKPSLMLFCYWFKFLQLFFIITPFT